MESSIQKDIGQEILDKLEILSNKINEILKGDNDGREE
tara:strand:+ start:6943 stop:7056 length:114 start_codon:yes stop_codon:yes gene_type:complete